MRKGRLEAFSDGVLAIILTIMVLDLKVPHAATMDALLSLSSVFICYVLSFVFLCIYWNNHHHLFHLVQKINGNVLLANAHLIFWLSLIPFTTAWMGENHFAPIPVFLYGLNLLLCSIAYYILSRSLVVAHDKNSAFARALGKNSKATISTVIYVIGIGLSFFNPWMAYAAYTIVTIMWLIPDRRFEESV